MSKRVLKDRVKRPSFESDGKNNVNSINVNEAVEIIKTLSLEARFKSLYMVGRQKMTVSELAILLRRPRASVSIELARLRREKLVEAERKGQFIYYQACDDRAQHIIDSTLRIVGCQKLRLRTPKK